MRSTPGLIGRRRFAALALSLLPIPFLAQSSAAQEAQERQGARATSEVPTSGARRPGPVIQASVRAPAPATEEPRPEGFTPVELQIESIDVAAPIEVGDIVDGAMANPSGPWVVAWYEPLGLVGEGENVVLSGHVDYWNTGPNGTAGPAVFFDVPDLQPGDVIRLLGEDGQEVDYAVEWTELYNVAEDLTPEVIQTEVVGDTGQESLTLITCGGPFDPVTGEYLERWVLRANQV